MMLSTEKFCEARTEWTWVYIARYSKIKWKHIRCKKEKDSKTETYLEPLLISSSGFVIRFYRMTRTWMPVRPLKPVFAYLIFRYHSRLQDRSHLNSWLIHCLNPSISCAWRRHYQVLLHKDYPYKALASLCILYSFSKSHSDSVCL